MASGRFRSESFGNTCAQNVVISCVVIFGPADDINVVLVSQKKSQY